MVCMPRPNEFNICIYHCYPLLNTAIYNGNKIEWSTILSVIVQVINKQNRCRPICLITSTDTMTDQIGRHEVLLPVNHTITKLYKGKGEKLSGKKT